MSVLKVSEVFCYICRSVLIKPITLPCRHVFCFNCFQDSMQETSYCCPLCRRRVSNWVRKAKKIDNLVNHKLWEAIIEQYRLEVNLKLHGEEDGLDERLKEEEEALTPYSISSPGEVGEEYSKMMSDYEAEREKLKAAEELASKQLISKLTEEEEMEIEAMKRDEEYAKKLHKELNKNASVSTRNNSKRKQKQKQKQKQTQKQKQRQTKKKVKGPMDNFLKNAMDMKIRTSLKLRLQERLNNRCASTDSTDSIQAEMHHFKPIKIVPRTPPKRHPDGKVVEISLTEVKPLKVSNVQNGITSYQASSNLTESKKIHSPYSAFIGKGVPYRDVETTESPRKRLRTADESESGGVLKEITLGENSDTKSMGQTDGEDGVKRKRNSPVAAKESSVAKKPAKNDNPANHKMFQFCPTEGNAEENENSDVKQQFETQDYLESGEGAKPELVEEQKRIENLILQEKEDRELALKLSQEWEGRYELRKKPKQKQVAVKKTMKIGKKKLQQTLIGTLVNTKGKDK